MNGTAPYTLRLPCLDADSATRCAEWLREKHELDVDGTDGTDALLPWGGSGMFAFDVFEEAVAEGFAADDAAAIIAQLEHMPEQRNPAGDA